MARFVADRSGEPPERIHEDFDYLDAGLLDSVGVIDLLFFVQDTFAGDVALGDIAVDRLRTAARVYDLVVSATRETGTTGGSQGAASETPGER